VRLVDETGTVVAEVQGARLWYLDAGAGPVMDDTLARRLYAIQWRPAPMTTVPSPRTGRWLIFADADGVGAAVAARLSGEGAGCVLVQPGERYEPLSPDRFLVRPGDREDIRRLLTTVLEGPGCAGIVHLWSLDGKVSADATAADLAAAQRLGCGSLLPLIQELAAARRPGRLPLWLVTRGAQPAGGVVAPDTLTAASVWGMGRTLAVEHADLWGGLVDLDPHAAAEQAAAMLDAQLLSADGEDQVAFRGDERFVARLVRTSSPRANRPARWRPDASYLITGGLGGLGLQVARWMVEQGARRIVLLGRSGLPPRGDWSAVDPASRTGRRISAVRELEALGASVHLAAVDVADEPALRHFLDAFRREAWPPIRGVVHAAGTVHYGPLVQTTEAQLDDVLRSKTTGAWLLHRLLAGDALDFFVLFSSASGVLSSPLVGAYAAANTFLDALAHHRVGEGQPALSIDWGLWAGAGMAEQVDADGLALLTARGMGSLPPEQALEALGAFLSSAAVQVGVIPVNWPVWRERYPMFTAAPFLADVLGGEIAPTVSGEATAVREDLLALEPAARAEAVRDRLRAHAAAVLRLDPATIDVNEPLTAFGIDSLMAVELKNRVDRDLGLSIPLVHYLDGSGIERLADALLDSAASARPVAPSAEGGEESALLAQLPEMSDDEVDALLKRMLAEPEGS
jgi:NAD(P)-dependent dehydrogenase (short-subunit alcohol dehydrogenase family)/acyl carrier protein